MSLSTNAPVRRSVRDDLQVDAIREVERLLALAELLRSQADHAASTVAALSEKDDDPMGRAAECVQFAYGRAEDVVGGLRRASDRLRDDLRIARRFP